MRFIPARAGNTSSGPAARCPRPVHPRSRGEHTSPACAHSRRHGSSPLARGTRYRAAPCHLSTRFIPARAGNTTGPRTGSSSAPVHPRSRGEHLSLVGLTVAIYGSSPLARGTRPEPARRVEHRRFIPARAGNTGARSGAGAPTSVHPRSRGEHLPPPTDGGHTTGSSPLARGTPQIFTGAGSSTRFIPARAGNTVSMISTGPSTAVHPRSRGEHGLGALRAVRKLGSSPLARGTLRPSGRGPDHLRFIPARAGNTPPAAGPGGA